MYAYSSNELWLLKRYNMEGLAFYLTFFIVGSPEVWNGYVDAMMDTSIKFVKEKACASDGYIWK